MRTIRIMLAVTAVLSAAGVMPARAAATDHPVLMSNFRFCPTRPFPCDPADIGYVAGSDGAPAGGQLNPIPIVTVAVGDTVTWTYDEPLCSAGAFCPPHTVTFNDGSFDKPGGSATYTHQGDHVTWTVPANAAGKTLLYVCRVHAPFGMNGAIQVAA